MHNYRLCTGSDCSSPDLNSLIDFEVVQMETQNNFGLYVLSN